jgi:hypothetical protein
MLPDLNNSKAPNVDKIYQIMPTNVEFTYYITGMNAQPSGLPGLNNQKVPKFSHFCQCCVCTKLCAV